MNGIFCDSPDTSSREVGNSGRCYGSVSRYPRMVQTKFNRTRHSVADLIFILSKNASFSEYLAYLGWCFYVGSWVVEILPFFIRYWSGTLTIILQLSFILKVFRIEGFIIQACRSNRKCYYQKFDHNLDLYLIRCFSFVDCKQPSQECSI